MTIADYNKLILLQDEADEAEQQAKRAALPWYIPAADVAIENCKGMVQSISFSKEHVQFTFITSNGEGSGKYPVSLLFERLGLSEDAGK